MLFGFCSLAASSDNNFNQAYNSFNVNDIKADVKHISSDKFAGREPSTLGGKLTTEFLVKEFKQLGLKPGNGDSYLQAVPMVSITSTPTKKISNCRH
jgi:hypothetical protein